MRSFVDQIGRKITLKNNKQRIVSLVPSQTELLIDLGLENELVGVTKFCIHPKDLKKSKTIVGGTKNIHIDKIKELKPTIILCNKEENTQEIVEACEKTCPVHVSDIYNIEESLELIEMYGKLFNCEEKASEIKNTISSELIDFQHFIKEKPTLNIAYFIWRNPWMVAGNDTFINSLLKINKLNNVYENLDRYPEVTLDKNTFSTTDLLLLSSEPYPFQEKHIEELKKITGNKNIILVDGEFFSWYGSRLQHAFDYFKKLRKTIS